MKIISLGEVLWDVYDDNSYLGGAPLNFSVNAFRLGHDVNLISAVGKDILGENALDRISELGLNNRFINKIDNIPTGEVIIKIDNHGQPVYNIVTPAAYNYPFLRPIQLKEIITFKPSWLYLGTLQQTNLNARKLTDLIIGALPKIKIFYDLNFRKGFYNLQTIERLLKISSIVKLNEEEFFVCRKIFNKGLIKIEEFCKWLVKDFCVERVFITRGVFGCSTYYNNKYIEVPAYDVKTVDCVGAGDGFSAAILHGLGKNWGIMKICDFANRIGALIVSHYGSLPRWSSKEINSLKLNKL